MTRIDLCTPVHKAVRVLLFETTTLAARTAFDDAGDIVRLAERVRALFGYLAEHQEHEDVVVMPEFRRLAPALFAELDNEHNRMAGMEEEILRVFDRLEDAGSAEREALGRKLQHQLHRLVSAQLVHLEREEVEGNRVLWANFDDASLAAMHARVLARIAPPRAMEWMSMILPALAPTERAVMLNDMRAKMPGAAFEALTAGARSTLGEKAWEAALAARVA